MAYYRRHHHHHRHHRHHRHRHHQHQRKGQVCESVNFVANVFPNKKTLAPSSVCALFNRDPQPLSRVGLSERTAEPASKFVVPKLRSRALLPNRREHADCPLYNTLPNVATNLTGSQIPRAPSPCNLSYTNPSLPFRDSLFPHAHLKRRMKPMLGCNSLHSPPAPHSLRVLVPHRPPLLPSLFRPAKPFPAAAAILRAGHPFLRPRVSPVTAHPVAIPLVLPVVFSPVFGPWRTHVVSRATPSVSLRHGRHRQWWATPYPMVSGFVCPW